ncbi:hypothetical protein BaRGS_00031157 [Batillaria attramentaria]|uniref:Sodium-coupled monocarboxylate transporter 1-like n=1 Tax=Batillaria attramentaria TaxID=370345 RepID=A0ABD0JSK4_9CAEN
MVDEIQTFRIADYAVFVITILISVAIGVYYAFSGGRQRTISEYLVGSRAMKFLPVAISLLVSNESSVMMLGLPAEAYVYGIQWIFSAVGTCVCQLLSVFIIVPLMHPLKITSIYEYLQYRFNSTAVRLLGTVLGMLNNVWYMGIVLFGPAIALEPVTGFSKLGCMISMAAIAVVYTSIGGFKAVVWTDVFQSIVMYLGMLAILIKGTVSVGSPAKVWEVADKGGRMNFFNFDFDPTVRHTFWTLFFATILRATGTVFSQATVQRISSTKTQREAKWVLIIMAPCYLVSLSLACYEGIIAYAYYETKGCDPLASNKLSDPNQMIPLMVMDLFRSLPGMPGLFLASLFSASLSTLSTHLNSLSAVLLTDIIKPRFRNMTELQGTIILKVSVIIFGIIGVGNALLVSMVGGPLTQVTTSLMSAFGGPLTGLFLLGCFFPCANKKGALGGVVLSLILSAWMSLGQSFSTTLKKTPWLPPASTAMCTANVTSGMLEKTASTS